MTPESTRGGTTYLYFDEAGNFDFSPNGTSIFVMTCIVVRRPFAFQPALLEVKYDCLEQGLSLEYFHAAEDRQAVRNEVFGVIAAHLGDVQAHVMVVRKNRVHPSQRAPHVLYQWTFEQLVRVACSDCIRSGERIVAVTDHVPVARNRAAFEKGLKPFLRQHLPEGARYELLHHQSKSDLNLQVADYISWAVYRKWNSGDLRSYRIVEQCIRSEVDPLGSRAEEYY
ncbi:MAG: DUF3800 domain-containing protein [Coriobacteriia bacterium]